MTGRITQDVTRGDRISITVDGQALEAFEGETIATAIMTVTSAFRKDGRGDPHGLFCNMGTCSECFVRVRASSGGQRRLRACVTPVLEGMTIETGAGPHG
jgi:sarcosine oxidase subunit alpha